MTEDNVHDAQPRPQLLKDDLRRKVHLPQSLKDELRRLYDTKEFADVTIFCQGVEFQAHKVCLCSQSEFFEKLFEGEKVQNAGPFDGRAY